MANSITLAKKYVPILDAIYKASALTSILDGDNTLVREGANVGELIVPKMVLQGQAAYSRNGGYVSGDAQLTWETIKADYDRGRKFNIDVMDDEETMNVAFGMLASEYIRTKVVPELDAWRFASYAGANGIGGTTGTLSAGDGVLTAISTGMSAMDEKEVSAGRILFITPTLHRLIINLDTTKSREVIDEFAAVVKVPQTRFYNKITLYDGTTQGQTDGGYVKAADGKDINFMIIEKSALVQFNKHVAPKIIKPEDNQTADGYSFSYRCVSVAEVYENKLDGVYCHRKA
jgi:hypothetical protein